MVSAAVAALALLFLGFAALAAANVRKLVAAPAPQPAREPSPDQRLAARRVLDAQGQPVGESVRATREHLVVKQGGGFALVPLALVREEGADVAVGGGADWAEAKRLGEEWRREHEDRLEFDAQGNLVV